MPRAAIDIGSNTLLLLVQDDAGVLLADEARIVGLGRGLGERGLFLPDRMDAALEVLRDFAEIARQLGLAPWEVRAVATSAARRALNAKTFFQRVEAETGLRVRIISGEEEAALTWSGALGGLQLPEGPIAVVDLGGGSTEIVVGTAERVLARQSLELGTVRLTETFFTAEDGRPRAGEVGRLRAHIESAVAGFVWPVLPRALVGVAGSATTLYAIEAGLPALSRDRVHGARLSRSALRRAVDRLAEAGPRERREIAAVAPERADYLLAGAIVLETLCTRANRDSLIVSDGGVRHGLLAAPT